MDDFGQEPSAPKKSNPIKWILLIIVGLAILVLCVCGGLFYAASQSEAGQAIKKVGGTVMEGMNAPGAKEVREAGNCQQAMVIDNKALYDIGKSFQKDGLAGNQDKPDDRFLQMPSVICQVPGPPQKSCEELSQVFYNATGTKEFMFIIQKTGGQSQHCALLAAANESGALTFENVENQLK